MAKARFLIALGGAAALAAPAIAADGAGQHSLSLRNATSARFECGIHKDGSSVVDVFTLKPGQVWTQTYADGKRRWLRCDGTYSDWQPLALDGRYDLLGAPMQRISAQPAAR